MSLGIRNTTRACALVAALGTSMPAFPNEDLYIAAAPPSVQPHNPVCKGMIVGSTYMEAQICRTLYQNQTPKGAIGLTHIFAQVKYPLAGNAPPWGKPNSYILWSMEVLQGSNTLFKCEYSGQAIYLKQGYQQVCAQGADSNITSPVYLRVTWINVGEEDGHVDTL